MTELLSKLCLHTGLREHEVVRIMLTAPSRYKVFNIKKRNGALREIAQPSPEVKLLQRALGQLLLNTLPVHDCATAYRAGSSIRANAEPHAKNGPILKLDLKNFFPSLRASDWIEYCKKTECLKDDRDIQLTSRLLFRKAKGTSVLRLAIGAPTSPSLSNILLYEFDVLIFDAVKNQRVTYTRYADDMTFSAPRLGYLNDVQKKVARVIRSLDFPNLDLNREKTTYVTKKYGRMVTGLTLANDGRVTIGRERKRRIRAAVHRATLGGLSPLELEVLAGTLAYVNAVEPEFIAVLRDHYGSEAISKIQATKRGAKLAFHAPAVAPHDLDPAVTPGLHKSDWKPRKYWF